MFEPPMLDHLTFFLLMETMMWTFISTIICFKLWNYSTLTKLISLEKQFKKEKLNIPSDFKTFNFRQTIQLSLVFSLQGLILISKCEIGIVIFLSKKLDLLNFLLSKNQDLLNFLLSKLDEKEMPYSTFFCPKWMRERCVGSQKKSWVIIKLLTINYNEMLPIYVCGRKHVTGQASV